MSSRLWRIISNSSPDEQDKAGSVPRCGAVLSLWQTAERSKLVLLTHDWFSHESRCSVRNLQMPSDCCRWIRLNEVRWCKIIKNQVSIRV